MSGMSEERSKTVESHRVPSDKDAVSGSQLWTDGLICAFEFIRANKRSVAPKSASKMKSSRRLDDCSIKNQKHYDGGTERSSRSILLESKPLLQLEGQQAAGSSNLDGQKFQSDQPHPIERGEGSCWVPIGWARISELVQTVQADAEWATQHFEFVDGEDDITVADLAAPYWERPVGPTWWCHLTAGHPNVEAWLNASQWLHPAIRTALRDESRLISDRMKHLLYEVPVRVAGGLLFELLGQSAGDPFVDEDDIPVVLRSWQAQYYLLTVLHVKGSASRINVLGITEVQELLLGGGSNTPRTAHEIIASLASRLARWDDRIFRKSIFGAADEVELKFVNRRNREDLNLLAVILNQEIRRLSRQVIRVKWSLHAREEIVFELLQHLRGNLTRSLLEGIRKSTREMIEEQEAVRGRLFTIQDVMQSALRAWLQDRSLTVTHNLAVFGGCGLVLSIITGLFGINVDGIPGGASTPYAFGLFAGLLFFLGAVLIVVGLIYLGLKKPIREEDVEVRKLELDKLVKLFQHEAETHAQVHKPVSRHNLPPTAGDKFTDDADYVLIT
ncbi:Magnesium transporter CorA-like family protein [Perilla frutescens var. hirtella]|uniref:Magnesium transporter CorA-like family protein n=1 Tax=Perilla frutescens var. hirtella TaxID=608512 RepID=A0AAD4J2K5_PERFH|nr:Magnesium transporter CorA-like family protein [Perilla frutescens var. hirtella]